MNHIKKPLRLLLAGIAALQLTACSKTVQWEEEVPLNSGETIVVKRSGTYTYRCEFAHGTGCGYGPGWRSTIAFTYKGKSYTHTDDAGLVLLAIAPDGTPNLVADARVWGNQHEYPCVTPYYVQFRPNDTIKNNWTWPQKIDPWLYNQPTNLIFGIAPLESNGKKYTAADRTQKNASLLAAGAHYWRIDSAFKPENCVRRNLNGK